MWSSYLNHSAFRPGKSRSPRQGLLSPTQRAQDQTQHGTAAAIGGKQPHRSVRAPPPESNSSRAQTAINPSIARPVSPPTHATVLRDGTDPTPLALGCRRPFPSPPAFSARPPFTPDARLVQRRPEEAAAWTAVGRGREQGRQRRRHPANARVPSDGRRREPGVQGELHRRGAGVAQWPRQREAQGAPGRLLR
jgi:hypothetical protein